MGITFPLRATMYRFFAAVLLLNQHLIRTAALSDLHFSWNTLNEGDEEGLDHEVIIACSLLEDNCLQSESGGKSRITIGVRGEEAAQRLLSNLTYLKNLSE